MNTASARKRTPASALIDPRSSGRRIRASFVKLDPRTLIKSPVMFVLEIVTALVTVIPDPRSGDAVEHLLFEIQIIVWLCSPCFCQFCRGGRRGARQGAGRGASAHQNRDASKLMTGPDRKSFAWCPA